MRVHVSIYEWAKMVGFMTYFVCKETYFQAFQQQHERVNANGNGFCIYEHGIATNEALNSKQSVYGTLNDNKHVTKSERNSCKGLTFTEFAHPSSEHEIANSNIEYLTA